MTTNSLSCDAPFHPYTAALQHHLRGSGSLRQLFANAAIAATRVGVISRQTAKLVPEFRCVLTPNPPLAHRTASRTNNR
jgi:hypothetical protein